MINRKISVHLQDFPDVSFFSDEQDLVANMDLVRNVCSAALALRDSKNLRVRLPLSELIVVGRNASRILDFSDVISDEVNVKKITTKDKIDEVAELKLQINFKKIGAKYGPKIKEITELAKKGEWKKIAENEIELPTSQTPTCLVGDEFEIKLTPKDQDEKYILTMPLPSNDCLVQLNVEITKELEQEGIARDVVRMIQQYRKDADFNVSDHIRIELVCTNEAVTNAVESFADYIKEQTLGVELKMLSEKIKFRNSDFVFDGVLDESPISVSLEVVK